MTDYKRLTLLCGHYGSGKTNIAVNFAFHLKSKFDNVALADLDIVNPYFRAKDSSNELKNAGIRVICSEYANTNVDIPALPQDMYTLTDDKSLVSVLDIGGDDRGAYALGRLVPTIIEEKNYDMLMVINKYRPLTPDAESVIEVMREIELACRLPFTGIVNNSNLGDLTTAENILNSVDFANEVARLSAKPVVMTAVRKDLAKELEGKIPNLFPMTLQARPFDSAF